MNLNQVLTENFKYLFEIKHICSTFFLKISNFVQFTKLYANYYDYAKYNEAQYLTVLAQIYLQITVFLQIFAQNYNIVALNPKITYLMLKITNVCSKLQSLSLKPQVFTQNYKRFAQNYEITTWPFAHLPGQPISPIRH